MLKKMKRKYVTETVLRDVLDTIDMAKEAPMEVIKRFSRAKGNRSYRSIASASEALTLVFPVIVSRNMSNETAAMITKAIERKAVVMLQMLFSAFNVTDAKDGLSFLKQFHSNINLSGKINIDKFIDIMDSFVTENADVLPASKKEIWEAFKEDMNNLSIYLGEDISEHALSDYRMQKKFSSIGEEVCLEAKKGSHVKHDFRRMNIGSQDYLYYDQAGFTGNDDDSRSYTMDVERERLAALRDDRKNYYNAQKMAQDDRHFRSQQQMSTNHFNRQMNQAERFHKDQMDNANRDYDLRQQQMAQSQQNSDRDYDLRQQQIDQSQRNSDRDYLQRQQQIDQSQRNSNRDYDLRQQQMAQSQRNLDRDYNQRVKDSEIRNNFERQKLANMRAKDNIDYLKNQLLDSDVKKANELVPTTMIVNFITQTADGTPVQTQMIIGVKARMYPVSSNDILTRLYSKHKDRNGLFKFIKATTREISFVRDFLFCIDKAKIDALSQSKLGSSSKLWKILERRAIMSKLNRNFNRLNDASAITTLAITQEEVEYMKKMNQIDLENPNIARPLMESYNFMGMVIADETDEIAKFIFDTGNDTYEELPYSQLDKEDKSHDWKKIVNLVTKMR